MRQSDLVLDASDIRLQLALLVGSARGPGPHVSRVAGPGGPGRLEIPIWEAKKNHCNKVEQSEFNRADARAAWNSSTPPSLPTIIEDCRSSVRVRHEHVPAKGEWMLGTITVQSSITRADPPGAQAALILYVATLLAFGDSADCRGEKSWTRRTKPRNCHTIRPRS